MAATSLLILTRHSSCSAGLHHPSMLHLPSSELACRSKQTSSKMSAWATDVAHFHGSAAAVVYSTHMVSNRGDGLTAGHLMMKVAQIVVKIRQKALTPPKMYSSFPCWLALPLTMALTFSVREPAKAHDVFRLQTQGTGAAAW